MNSRMRRVALGVLAAGAIGTAMVPAASATWVHTGTADYGGHTVYTYTDPSTGQHAYTDYYAGQSVDTLDRNRAVSTRAQ